MFPFGITTVSCSATDAAGNTATASFMVTIVNTAATGDTTPPTLSQPDNIVQQTTLANGATVNYTLPTATDNEAVTFGPSCTPSSGSLFSIGSTTVTCIARDEAGNQGSVSFNVVVTQPATLVENTLTLQLDQTSYVSGDSINIAGVAIGDVSDVSITILAPNGNIVSVSQIAPDAITASQESGMQVKVQNAPGSSTPGCEETNSCFLPNSVTIDAGDTIVWENTDNAAHTATSGSPEDGPSGYFDSNLIMSGGSYSVTLDDPGTYDYFCMVHPWMTGKVVVGGSETVVEPIEPVVVPEESESSDAEVIVENALGSSTRGCEETNSCFIPSTVTIQAGGTVTWENPDIAAHTTTSHIVAEQGIGGIVGLEWDSGLMLKGKSFSHTFDDLSLIHI